MRPTTGSGRRSTTSCTPSRPTSTTSPPCADGSSLMSWERASWRSRRARATVPRPRLRSRGHYGNRLQCRDARGRGTATARPQGDARPGRRLCAARFRRGFQVGMAHLWCPMSRRKGGACSYPACRAVAAERHPPDARPAVPARLGPHAAGVTASEPLRDAPAEARSTRWSRTTPVRNSCATAWRDLREHRDPAPGAGAAALGLTPACQRPAALRPQPQGGYRARQVGGR